MDVETIKVMDSYLKPLKLSNIESNQSTNFEEIQDNPKKRIDNARGSILSSLRLKSLENINDSPNMESITNKTKTNKSKLKDMNYDKNRYTSLSKISMNQSYDSNILKYQSLLSNTNTGANHNLSSSLTIKKKKSINTSIESMTSQNYFNNPTLEMFSRNEEIIKQNKTLRQKQIEETSRNLYMLSFANREIKEKIKQEFEKISCQKDKETCTFKPSLITPKKVIDSEVLKLGFAERREHIKQKFTEKLEKVKNEKSKNETDSCTFKPEINRLSPPKPKKQSENKVLKKYLERQKNAQQKKKEDKLLVDTSIRIKPDINNVYDKLYNKKSKEASASVKEKQAKITDSKQNKKKNNENILNLEEEKIKIRSQLQAINSISLI